MADKSSKTKQTKSTKNAKGGKGGKGGVTHIQNGIEAVSVASHPRTAGYVRRAKGWGGLGGFAVATLLSLKASVPVPQTLERALLAGILGYVICWALAVVVCRQMVLAEMRAIRDQLQAPPPSDAPAAGKNARQGRDPGQRTGARAGRTATGGR